VILVTVAKAHSRLMIFFLQRWANSPKNIKWKTLGVQIQEEEHIEFAEDGFFLYRRAKNSTNTTTHPAAKANSRLCRAFFSVEAGKQSKEHEMKDGISSYRKKKKHIECVQYAS
jgi:hypothetical protein